MEHATSQVVTDWAEVLQRYGGEPHQRETHPGVQKSWELAGKPFSSSQRCPQRAIVKILWHRTHDRLRMPILELRSTPNNSTHPGKQCMHLGVEILIWWRGCAVVCSVVTWNFVETHTLRTGHWRMLPWWVWNRMKWAALVLSKDADLLLAQKTRKEVNWSATAAGLLGLCPGWAVEKSWGTDQNLLHTSLENWLLPVKKTRKLGFFCVCPGVLCRQTSVAIATTKILKEPESFLPRRTKGWF